MPWKPIHPIINGKKKCIQCEKIIHIEDFAKQKKCKDGIRPTCKECIKIKSKKYYEKNKEKVLHRAREYGKTEYRKKYCRDFAKIKLKEKREKQASRPRPEKCEICDEKPTNIQGIVWDHNHRTGVFRGWLCNRCNRVLGLCKDSTKTFKRFVDYLETHG